MTRVGGNALAVAVLMTATVAGADIISVPEAVTAMERGELILLDIRSVEEWKETGLPEGALPVSVHTRDFGQMLTDILSRKGTAQVGLICATGGRTSHVLRVLDANGIRDVVDVSEGMLGNANGPGWIARDLPVSTADMAKAALASFLNRE